MKEIVEKIIQELEEQKEAANTDALDYASRGNMEDARSEEGFCIGIKVAIEIIRKHTKTDQS